MAIVQTDGASTVTNSSTVNNGGTAINVGSSSSVLSNQSLGRDDQGVFGSTVIAVASGDYADPALSAGVFAYNNVDPISIKITDTLAGTVSNDALLSGAADNNRRSIHRQEVVRTTRTTTAIRAGEWNIYSGSWGTPPTTAVDDHFDNANDTTSVTSTDEAASPSRDVPGELVYKLGQPVPVQVDYEAKTT